MTLSKKTLPQKASRHSVKHPPKSKRDLKAYWPYIPILLIGVAGYILNSYLNSLRINQNSMMSYRLSSNHYLLFIQSSIGIIALVVFLLRHAFAWHKVFVYGEEFAAKHPMLDITLVSIAVFGSVLVHNDISII